MRSRLPLLTLSLLLFPLWSFSQDRYKPIELHPDYEHDKFGTQPVDIQREFRAYVVSFDGDDDDDGDDGADFWAIPHWVAYEIKEFEGTLGKGPDRPSPWLTESALDEKGIAPTGASYHFSRDFRKQNPGHAMLGYDRGHMCMKQHAWRLGANADWNTHTVLNACPQRSDLNQGIWLDLEQRTAEWADEYGSVWIITGPVVFNRTPTRWLGQDGETPVAIPDAFFKIVAREPEDGLVETLAFIYLQDGIGYRRSGGEEYDHTPHLTSIDIIEVLTGLDFFTELPDDVDEIELERVIATELWP